MGSYISKSVCSFKNELLFRVSVFINTHRCSQNISEPKQKIPMILGKELSKMKKFHISRSELSGQEKQMYPMFPMYNFEITTFTIIDLM